MYSCVMQLFENEYHTTRQKTESVTRHCKVPPDRISHSLENETLICHSKVIFHRARLLVTLNEWMWLSRYPWVRCRRRYCPCRRRRKLFTFSTSSLKPLHRFDFVWMFLGCTPIIYNALLYVTMWYPLYDFSVAWMDHCQVRLNGGAIPNFYGIMCNFVQFFANS